MKRFWFCCLIDNLGGKVTLSIKLPLKETRKHNKNRSIRYDFIRLSKSSRVFSVLCEIVIILIKKISQTSRVGYQNIGN